MQSYSLPQVFVSNGSGGQTKVVNDTVKNGQCLGNFGKSISPKLSWNTLKCSKWKTKSGENSLLGDLFVYFAPFVLFVALSSSHDILNRASTYRNAMRLSSCIADMVHILPTWTHLPFATDNSNISGTFYSEMYFPWANAPINAPSTLGL